jgi:arylsulfatase A-like enzyme
LIRKISMAALAFGLVLPTGAMGEPPALPNIVFILADDHNQESISAYQGRYSEIAPTPNIDRLAAEGMTFHHMTAVNSICGPSRAALISGKHSHLNGVLRNKDVFDGSQQTFPKLLQAAGYQTALIGKWHLISQPTGFDYYSVLPGQGRYHDPLFKRTGEPWKNGKRGGTVVPGYCTDVITDQAVDWLANRNPSKPFFLMVHHKAPHGPHDPAPRHKDLFTDVTIPAPDNLLDDYEGRAIQPVSNNLRNNRLLQRAFKEYKEHDAIVQRLGREEGTKHMYQVYMKGYLRLIATLDENIGRLLDYLDRAGLRENTIVVFTSDNGYFNGEHGFYNKMWMYEESLHLPLLVRYPGVVSAGSECRQLAGILDFAPTFLELAGAPVPADLQGTSLMPLLRGKDQPIHDALYYRYYGAFDVPEQIGIRTTTHKLVFYPDLKENNRELFDLRKDPAEMNNLCNQPEQQEQVKALTRQLNKLIKRYEDDTARFPGVTTLGSNGT